MIPNLIIYYSLSGHTRAAAEIIQQVTGGALASIRTRDEYPPEGPELHEQGRKEVTTGFLPALNDFPADLAAYDVVFLGCPVWWHSMAPAMKSFLAAHSLAGKTVIPFVTCEGGGGHALTDLSAAAEGAAVKSGLVIRFSEGRSVLRQELVVNWARNALKSLEESE